MDKSKQFTQEELAKYFYYDEGLLRNKITRCGKAVKDRVAGSLNLNGYLAVQLNGVTILNHRVIFLLCKGYLPEEIDHADRNKTNNRIENLRDATRSQNIGNQELRRSNTSGYKGVSWHKGKKKWCAKICVHGEQVHLGNFWDVKDAAAAYDRVAKIHFEQFAVTNDVD